MRKKETLRPAKRLKKLRSEQHLTQKEAAAKAHITESAYCVCELGDRNPEPEILDRIAKALRVRLEYLSAPMFRNRREFAYMILENGGAFGYSVHDIDGIDAIVAGPGPAMGFFAEFTHDWEEVCKKLDDGEIT